MYSVIPTTASHGAYIRQLENNPLLDFWSDGWRLNQKVDIMVATEIQAEFEEQLRSRGIEFSVSIDNVEG